MIRNIREARDEEGFTLIELLVVVIIIGILAAIAIPAFLNQRQSAYVAAAESDARNAAIEVETYFTQNDAYPAAVVPGPAPAAPAANTLYVENSANVTLTYAVTGGGQTYTISADHSLADADGDGNPVGDADAFYDSAAGGLQ